MEGESSYQCSNAAPFFFINVPLLPTFNRSNALKIRLIYSTRIIVVARGNNFKRFPRLNEAKGNHSALLEERSDS